MSALLNQPMSIILIKITLVLLVAMIVSRVLRRASAAIRHLVWMLAIFGALLLPFFVLSLSEWKIARNARSATPLSRVASQNDQQWRDNYYARFQEKSFRVSEVSKYFVTPANIHMMSESISDVEQPRLAPASLSKMHALPWSVGIVAVWMVGSVLLMARFLVGLGRAWRAGRRSVALDARAAGIAAKVQAHSGVRQRVTVRQAAEGGVSIPITWGVVHPIVLLPAQSSGWTDECLRAVLFHEFAHISRFDWLWRCMAHLACSVFWFHPMVWMAARQARETSERACDDCVLRSGVTPSDYAERLIDVLKSLPPDASVKSVAIPMAIPRETEGRVRAILAPEIDRASVKPGRLLIAAAVTASVVLPLSILHLPARAQVLITSESHPPPLGGSHFRPSAFTIVYLRDVACRRAPKRSLMLSTGVSDVGATLFRFTDRRSGMTFGDGAEIRDAYVAAPIPHQGSGAASHGLTLTTEQKHLRHEQDAWAALIKNSPVILSNSDIDSADEPKSLHFNEGLSSPHSNDVALSSNDVVLTLNPNAARRLAAFMEAHFSENIGILHGDALIAAPLIVSPIQGRKLLFSGFIGVRDGDDGRDYGSKPLTGKSVASHPSCTLPNGLKIRIGSIQRVSGDQEQSYVPARRAEGKMTASTQAVYEVPYGASPYVESVSVSVETFAGTGALHRAYMSSRVSFERLQMNSRVFSASNQFALRFPASQKSFAMRIGVAAEPWRTVSVLSMKSGLDAKIPSVPDFRDLPVTQAEIASGRLARVTLEGQPCIEYRDATGRKHHWMFMAPQRELDGAARQVFAIDREGRYRWPQAAAKSAIDNLSRHEQPHNDLGVRWYLDLTNVKEIRLQTRPYQYAEIHNIPLPPG
ncbi:MAG: peptidase BlaR1 [Capsulimonas sp.]|nr:peptidase BlaR1 [Capsulimonas sp.]